MFLAYRATNWSIRNSPNKYRRMCGILAYLQAFARANSKKLLGRLVCELMRVFLRVIENPAGHSWLCRICFCAFLVHTYRSQLNYLGKPYLVKDLHPSIRQIVQR
jgi:hypothetical protein